MRIRVCAIRGMMVLMPWAVTACHGSTPTSPSRTCVLVGGGATSTTLAIGDLFRFRFTVPARPDVDLAAAFIGEGASGWSQSTATVRLYDGARLLGAIDDYQDTVVFLKSPSAPASVWGVSGPAAIVDFSSIVNGTIDGRVEFSVTRGAVQIARLDLATIVLLRSASDLPDAWVHATISGREVCR